MFLVTALATVSCNPSPRPASRVVRPSEVQAPAPTEAEADADAEGFASRPGEAPTVFVEAPELPEAQAEPLPVSDPVPQRPTCDNDVGRVDCSPIRSTCESLQGTCDLLATYPYRPRVAEAIAACWARAGDRACNIRVRQRCNLEGIRQACLDPQFEPVCEANLRRCAEEGITPAYTRDECVQVLSSLSDAGERDWSAGAMGPTREGCKLMFPVY